MTEGTSEVWRQRWERLWWVAFFLVTAFGAFSYLRYCMAITVMDAGPPSPTWRIAFFWEACWVISVVNSVWILYRRSRVATDLLAPLAVICSVFAVVVVVIAEMIPLSSLQVYLDR